MRRFSVLLLCLVVFYTRQSIAHFLLNYPPTIGFDDNLEATAPCGSFTVNFSTDNVTNFHVGGDSLAMTSIHPQATWLFRATLDITASGNWTNLLPAIVQTGLGGYCETDVTVPASWAGSKGVISIVQDAPDGILYQCAAVNFVAGSIAPPAVCTNVTGLMAAYTTDPALSTLPATATLTSAATSVTGASLLTSMTGGAATTTPSSTSASASAASTPSAANTVRSYTGLGAAMWVLIMGCAALVTYLL